MSCLFAEKHAVQINANSITLACTDIIFAHKKSALWRRRCNKNNGHSGKNDERILRRTQVR